MRYRFNILLAKTFFRVLRLNDMLRSELRRLAVDLIIGLAIKPRANDLLLRKEVIQPQVPLRLPCYDFIPVTAHTLGR